MAESRTQLSKGYYVLMSRGKVAPRRPELISKKGELTEPPIPSAHDREESTGESQELPEGQYYVEKLLAQRRKGSNTEYLVQWKGYPMEACSWECASNIGSKPKRDFNHPQPREQLIRECVDRFLAVVDRSLRIDCHKDTVIRIAFSHEDFSSTYFPPGWDQCYRQFGSTNPTWRGRCIVYPLEVKCKLWWSRRSSFVRQQDSTFTHKPSIVEELLRISITKINC